MPKWFTRAALLCGFMFAVTPVLIALAPYEREMGLVQKIFYYHLPSAWMFLLGGIICGVASARFLMTGDSRHDRLAWATAELVVLFGAITLSPVRCGRARHGVSGGNGMSVSRRVS